MWDSSKEEALVHPKRVNVAVGEAGLAGEDSDSSEEKTLAILEGVWARGGKGHRFMVGGPWVRGGGPRAEGGGPWARGAAAKG